MRTCDGFVRIVENTVEARPELRVHLAGLLTRLKELGSYLRDLATFLEVQEEHVAHAEGAGSSAHMDLALRLLWSQCDVVDASSIW